MIPFEQAIQIIETVVSPLSPERVSLQQSLNRILAMNVFSDTDMPPFNKAAMDGFACRKTDLEHELEIIAEIQAGMIPIVTIGPDQCARIMTGAMVPEGADFVLMQEHVQHTGRSTIRRTRVSTSENICYRGEDVRSGELILRTGILIKPAPLAMLAAVGCTEPWVYKRPDVAVISTGNELVEPVQIPGMGRIRNGNGYQLTAQVSQQGITPDYLGIIPDEEPALLKVLDDAIRRYDVVLVTGGVSVGDYDFIPRVLRQLKVDILFHGMQVKPGRHLLFGKKGHVLVVGMPGNPVSSFVQFEVLVKPLLYRLMGCPDSPVVFQVPLEQPYARNKKDTLFFIPVNLTDRGTAQPLEYHGSAHIHAYTRAKGIMEVPVGVSTYQMGDKVNVRPI